MKELKLKTLYTVHFFDWYRVSEDKPLESINQRWTYKVPWEDLGIKVEEIGTSANYYQKQWEMIKDAGFDGVYWEWHRNNPSAVCIQALKNTDTKLGIFYDMQIIFHSEPGFIKPTAEFADTMVADIKSFYTSLPHELWLRHSDGSLPMIFYGYQFDRRSIRDVDAWHQFYSRLIDGLKNALANDVKIYWTDAMAPQQCYAYQHFPEIKTFYFNPTHWQMPINPGAYTFVVNYDDLGDYRKGNRAQRLIVNDIRHIQETLWLAKHSPLELVFFYGWNELYEGENILPDTTYGDWRYRLTKAMVEDMKAHSAADCPKVMLIADDILPNFTTSTVFKRFCNWLSVRIDYYFASLFTASGFFRRCCGWLSARLWKPNQLIQKEMDLLYRLRVLIPNADAVIAGEWDESLAENYDIIVSVSIATPEKDIQKLARLRKDKVVMRLTPDASEAQLQTLLGSPDKLNQGVIFANNCKTEKKGKVTIHTNERAMVVQEEELPIDEIKFVASADYAEETEKFVLPKMNGKITADYISPERKQLNLEKSLQDGFISLKSGDVVVIRRGIDD